MQQLMEEKRPNDQKQFQMVVQFKYLRLYDWK